MNKIILLYDVPFEKILEYRETIKNWHPEIANETDEQLNKFKGLDNYDWFMIFDSNDNLVAVACTDLGIYDDKVYLNMIWSAKGFGKIAIDKLYKFYRECGSMRPGKKSFTFNAINDVVSNIYKTKYVNYNFIGRNEWGYDEFEREF